MNQAEVLCHSSGPWKKHKYFQKIGEGANAVYKYARKNITGSYYKDRYLKKEDDINEDIDKLWRGGSDSKDWHAHQTDKDDPRTASRGLDKFHHDNKQQDDAEKAYYNKSLRGKIEKTVASAKGESVGLDSLQLRTEKAKKEERKAKVKETTEKGEALLKKLFGH